MAEIEGISLAPDWDTVVTMRDSGTGNMGDVSDEENEVGRFELEDDYLIEFVRITFTGGTGDATCTMYIDSAAGSQFDHPLHEWENAGTGNPCILRLDKEAARKYRLCDGDDLVFEWTNPDAGNMQWAIEIGVVPSGVGT